MLCSEAIAVNRNNFEGEYSLLRCKRWSCELCQGRNRWKVLLAIQRGQPNRMLTLSCVHGKYGTPEEAAHDMKRGLVALRKRMARKWPKRKFPMVVVFEAHKSGWPHMHICLRSTFIDIHWLKAAWEEIIGAWNVDIRIIPDPTRSARYVSKYLGKDLHHFEGCKRWWRTHDYEIEKEEARIKVTYGQRTEFIEGMDFDDLRERMRADPLCEITGERSGWFSFKRTYWHFDSS